MEKDYICGCGKSYGSYPAFSTHRKNKHNNQTVEGTKMPTQEKSKRGRPSCEFKKVPELIPQKRQNILGLNSIELGLLQLEQIYKGKILSDPSSDSAQKLKRFDHVKDEEGQRIELLNSFTEIVTRQMKKETSLLTKQLIQKLVQFGLKTQQLLSINLYNSFCVKNYPKIKNSNFGLDFCANIFLMLSKWLCIMGATKEILRMKAK